MEIVYQPIGVIHSPFQSIGQMPIQPTGESTASGTAVIHPEYSPGLSDLEGFSHLILLYHFHRAPAPRLNVTPFLDDRPHGVFATRAPVRPNPIGLSVVELVGITGDQLDLNQVDVLDGTPLLDIKPYVPDFDTPDNAQVGWLNSSSGQVEKKRSDTRFTPEENVGN
jgi:tRNA-Thr(GGU) m(6)t(6)A37 methyltransferase TsaA